MVFFFIDIEITRTGLNYTSLISMLNDSNLFLGLELNFKAHAFHYYFGMNDERAVGRHDSETG